MRYKIGLIDFDYIECEIDNENLKNELIELLVRS